MKICFLADGKSIHTQRWCRHFSSLGHEIHLITFQPTEIEGTRVHHIDAGNISVGGGNWRVILKVGMVKRLLRHIRPDILHAMYATSYGIVGRLSGFHPFVLTALGTDVLISPFRSVLYKLAVRSVLRKADWITAMSDPMKAVLLDLGASPERTDTVIFGIDTSLFNNVGRKLNLEKFVIISTRNLEPVYQIGLILDALNQIKGKIPGMEVRIIGDGTLRSQLEEKVKNNELSGFVHFKGKISQKELVEQLKGSHLFISASLSDGNNISLNEAMACGCYCLASDIPPNRIWIREGENGFLFPVNSPEHLADRILYVYNNFTDLSATAGPLNKRLINEKADWKLNMKEVESKYKLLISP